MGWVNIENEKPRYGQNVIAVGTWYGEINQRGNDGYMGIGRWKGDYVSIDSDTYTTDIVDVTHWMPLPPYP